MDFGYLFANCLRRGGDESSSGGGLAEGQGPLQFGHFVTVKRGKAGRLT